MTESVGETESPAKQSRRLERLARDAVDAAKDDRSADAVNLVEAGVAEDPQAFALHLLGIAARAERMRGRPVPDRESLRWLRWRLLGYAVVMGVFGTSLLLSWLGPDSWFACRPDWVERSVRLSGVILFGRYVVASARLLSGARAVLARIEGGKPNPVEAVVGDPKGLGTVLEALDGTSGWIELRADLGKPQRYTEGQEVAVYGPLRAGAVVAVSAAGGVHWTRVKRMNPVGSRRSA